MGRNAATSYTLHASKLLLGSLVILDQHFLSVVHAIRATDGQKSLVPSCGLAMQVHPEGLVVNTSQSVKGLSKELSRSSR